MKDLQYLYNIKKEELFEDIFDEYLENIAKDYFSKGKRPRVDLDSRRYSRDFKEVIEGLKGLRRVLIFLDDEYPRIEELDHILLSLEELAGINKKGFSELKKWIGNVTDAIEEDFSEFCGLTIEEVERLDESIVSLSNYCYYSVVINAVVAIESRLRRITKKPKKDRTILKDLITELDAKDNINGVKLPEKYRTLLLMLKSYRNIAAHSKKTGISYYDALAILYASTEFLLDFNWYRKK